jgi:hypothetical protein
MSSHWRAPVPSRKLENNQGPVLGVAEYRIDAKNRAAFLGAIDELGHARRRDGAYAWGICEDVPEDGRFIETFSIESWLELMHTRERIANAGELIANQAHQLLTEAPRITTHVSPTRPDRT